MVSRGRADTISHLHDRSPIDQERQEAAQIGIVAEMPEVDRQTHAVIRLSSLNEIVDDFQCVDEPR